MTLPAIQTVHRVIVYFDAPIDVAEAIEARAFSLATPAGIDLESFCGNPAYPPYLQAECCDRLKLELWLGKITRYINRRKGAKLS